MDFQLKGREGVYQIFYIKGKFYIKGCNKAAYLYCAYNW